MMSLPKLSSSSAVPRFRLSGIRYKHYGIAKCQFHHLITDSRDTTIGRHADTSSLGDILERVGYTVTVGYQYRLDSCL